MKLVSVVMPTYKEKGGLRRAVLSVLDQTYSDVELIVVDDNDPQSEFRKRTELVMGEFLNNPKVIYLKHEKNKNGAAARNTGICASHGDYIAFLDDDDWFLKEKIEKQVAYLEQHQEYSAVYNYALRDGKQIPTTPYEGDNSKPLLMMQTRMYTPSLCFRAEAIKDINGFDESFRRHQDYEMLLRFFAARYRIGCLKEYLTELGVNMGENIPNSEKMFELKQYFFDKFEDTIVKLAESDKSFRRRVYAKHYGSVAWYALKNKNYELAIRLFCKYFFYSPSYFTIATRSNVKSYLSRRIKKNR